MVPRWPSLASKPAPALPTTGWLLACCAHVFLLSAPLTAECASLAGPGRRVGSNTGVHLLLMQTRIYRVHSEHQVKTPLPCAGQDGSQTRVFLYRKEKPLECTIYNFLETPARQRATSARELSSATFTLQMSASRKLKSSSAKWVTRTQLREPSLPLPRECVSGAARLGSRPGTRTRLLRSTECFRREKVLVVHHPSSRLIWIQERKTAQFSGGHRD